MSRQILLFMWLAFAVTQYASCQSFPTVNTPSGPIKGVVIPALEQDVVQFRNIPFAKPPVGDLRFKKPLPVEPWTETRDGTKFGASCMQDVNVMKEVREKAENKDISEDCLWLNVLVPKAVSTTDKKPVMVWIHGGAFQSGSAWTYDSSFFALKDVIVVTIQYRLGIFGFLSTGDATLPGNYGLWDMIEALIWVNKNIEAFGGDPDTVTIFGESAGGFAVSFLALMPRNEGLFKRVITQSGSPAGFMAVVDDPLPFARKFGNITGCLADDDSAMDSEALVECLKQKSADDLSKAQSNPAVWSYDPFSLFPQLWAVVDGELIVKHPYESLNDPNSEESAFFRSLDLLGGTTDNEASLVFFIFAFLQKSHEFNITDGIPTSVLCDVFAPALAKEMFNDETIVSDLICKEYSASSLDQQGKNIGYLYEDSWFIGPTVKLLDFHTKDNLATGTYQYLYSQTVSFDILIPTLGWMEGAGHGMELLFLFGPTVLNDWHESLSTKEAKTFSDILVTYWTNFAKTGNPNGDGLLPWKPYTVDGRDYMELKFEPVQGHNLYEKRMKFLHEDIPNKLKSVKTEL